VVFEVVIFMAVSELTLDEYGVLFSLVSSEHQERVKRFRFFGDAQNCLVGDVLARVEICRVTGLGNRQLEFAVNSYGKPFLVNDPCLHYNISHAGHCVACVVSDVPVGIDVEVVRSVDMRVVERFFALDEQEYVLSAQKDVQRQRFFEVWTKKESRIKWAGKGLLESLSSFSVLDTQKRGEVFYHRVYDNGEVICHVCSSKEESPLVRVINTIKLFEYIQSFSKGKVV